MALIYKLICVVSVAFVRAAPQDSDNGGAPDSVDLECTLTNCRSEFANCFGTSACLKTLICLGSCNEDNPRCGFDCGFFDNPDPNLIDFITCNTVNKCSAVENYGSCHGRDNDVDPSVSTPDQIVGQWWVIRGLNCGNGASGPGYGWDNFPCYSETITKSSDGTYASADKYCYDKNRACIRDDSRARTGGRSDTRYIDISASLEEVGSGIFKKRLMTPGQKLPQFKRVRTLAVLAPDVFLVSSCAMTGSIRINNVQVISKSRDRVLSDDDIKMLSQATAKVGVNFNQMCTIDNSRCQP